MKISFHHDFELCRRQLVTFSWSSKREKIAHFSSIGHKCIKKARENTKRLVCKAVRITPTSARLIFYS